MQKLFLSIFLIAISLLFGAFFLSDNVLAQQKITCEEWLSLGTSSCKYYSPVSTEKNQTKDLKVYCFSGPEEITDRGSSYDFEINSRPPDYIAAFDWTTCGFGGAASPSATVAKTTGLDSLNCKELYENLKKTGGPNMLLFFNELGDPVGFKTEDIAIEKKDGSSCIYIFDWGGSRSRISTAKVTYLNAPPASLVNEGDDFEVINSDDKSYGGITVNGTEAENPEPDTLPYRVGDYNYAKSASLLGNCLIEAKQEFYHGDNNPFALDSEEQFRNEMKENLRIVNTGTSELLNNSYVKSFCGGGSGSLGTSSNPISAFFSKLFSWISNIFKPASQKTLGVTTSDQDNSSGQIVTFIIVGAVVALVIWFLTKKKSFSRKRSSRRKSKR